MTSELRKPGMIPYRCPDCRGVGQHTSKPEWPGDPREWLGTGPWPCERCKGTGVLWMAAVDVRGRVGTGNGYE